MNDIVSTILEWFLAVTLFVMGVNILIGFHFSPVGWLFMSMFTYLAYLFSTLALDR